MSAQLEFNKLIQDGKQYYENGDYERARNKFIQALTRARVKGQFSEVYFELALAYYANGQSEKAKESLSKLLGVDPGKIIDERYFPSGFIDIFNQLKKGYVPTTKKPTRPVVKSKPIVGKAPKKGGGGVLLALGAIVLGGGAALALLGGKKADSSTDTLDTPDTPVSTTGSIQLNSTPTGASVILDGSSTGLTTNVTLTGISAGSHIVGLVKEGYGDYQSSVSVSGGATSTVNASLSQTSISISTPTSSSAWQKGETVEIQWTSGGGSSNLQGNMRTTAGNPVLYQEGDSPSLFQRRFLQLNRLFRNSARARSVPDRARIRSPGIKSSLKKLSSSSSSPVILSSSSPPRGAGDIDRRVDDSGFRKRDKVEGFGVKKRDRINRSNERKPVVPFSPGSVRQKRVLLGESEIQAITNVKIELYRDDTSVQTITSTTQNDGSYTWTVNASLPEADNYKLRLSCAGVPEVFSESDTFRIAPILTGVIDNPDIEVETGGDADWFGQADAAYSGSTAAQSGPISHNESTYIESTVAGGGALSFYWKVSSEFGYDYLKFYIDDVLQDSISGEVDWELKTYALGGSTLSARSLNQGPYTLKWEYSKDSIVSDGQDCGWIDGIELGDFIEVTSPTSSTIWGKGKEVEIEWDSSGATSVLGSTGINTGINPTLYTEKKVPSSNPENEQSFQGSVKKQKTSTAAPLYSLQNRTSSGNRELLVVTDVKIELFKADTHVQTIVTSTANTGSYTWTTGLSLADGTDYKIKISSTADYSIYGESDDFSIEERSITVSDPTSSSVWIKGGSEDITWTYEGTISYVDINLYKGGTWERTIIEGTPCDGEYTWYTVNTSLADGTDYTLKISDSDDSNFYDESDEFEITSPTITVTKPTGSTFWSKGKSADIEWTWQGSVSWVKIKLYKGSTVVNTIESLEYNEGTFTWSNVDSSLEDGTDYKVRVENYYDSTVYGESAQFEIGVRSITVTNPTGSTVWSQGDSVDIEWTSEGSVGNVNIKLYHQQYSWQTPTLVKTIISNTENDGSYTWAEVDTSLASLTYYYVEVSSASDSEIYDKSDNFTITERSITVTRPASSDNWTQGDSIDIEWTSEGSVSNVKIDLYKGGSFNQTIADNIGNSGSYTWTEVDPSLEDGTDYKIRISDASDPAIFDDSDNISIEQKTITLTQPTSSTKWSQGDSANITWNSTGAISDVKIDLYKGINYSQTIVDSTVNSGSYTWAEVDTSLADGTDYKIKISDAFDSAISDESDEFTMEGKSIAVTAPTGSSIWTKGYSAGITWTSAGSVTNVKIDLYKDSIFSETIVGNVTNSGSYTWTTVPTYLEDGTDYTIKISDANDAEVFNESDAFTIEEKTITVTEPTSSTIWSQGDSADITWTSEGSISNVNIKLYHQQYSHYIPTLVKTIISNTENDGSYTWAEVDPSLASLTYYFVEISSVNEAGIFDKSDKFTITERSITVTNPTSSTGWTQGDSVDIEWTSVGSVSNVKIELYKGITFNQTIVESTENSGSYTWPAVDSSLPDGTDYKIKISATSDSTISDDSYNFSIEQRSLTITQPTTSTNWSQGDSADITWTSTGSISNVKIDLYTGITFTQTIVESTGNNGSYTWPEVNSSLPYGTDYKVKISYTGDSAIYDESDEFTIDFKSIAVTAPTGSTVWDKGYSADITWISTGSVNNVKIDLYKGGYFSVRIVGDAANSGSYTWTTVNAYLEDGTDYTIKISDANDAGVFNDSDEFTIEEKSITVTEPTSSTIWTVGQSEEITWTSKGAIDNVKIEVLRYGSLETTITESTENDGSYTWPVTGTFYSYSNYTVRISSASNSSIYDNSASFKIESKSINVTGPTSGAAWTQGLSGDITWNTSGTISHVKIDLYKGGSLNQTIEASTENDGSYTWAEVLSSLPDGTDYKVRITCISVPGIYDESDEFAIEQRSITVTNPTSSTIWIKGYIASFSWTTGGAISEIKIDLYKGGAQLQTIISSTGNTGTYSWTVDSSLANGADYEVRISDASDFAVYGESGLFEITPSYVFVTKWGTNGSGAGQFKDPSGVAADSSGNVYVADTYNHRIQKFTSNGTFVTQWGSQGSSGESKFSYPAGIAIDSSGNVYVADTSNDRIQKFTSSGTYISEWGSYGSSQGKLNNPEGLAVDSSGNVYVADRSNDRIQKFTSSGTYITQWGTDGSGSGQFSNPSGVAVDSSGNVYVVDTSNHRIQKFTSSGAYLTKWGSSGNGDEYFYYPWGIAVDSSNNVYVSDEYNYCIKKFTSGGSFIIKWGGYGSGDGKFIHNKGIAVDSSGNVYVSDEYNERIQKFQPISGGSGLSGANSMIFNNTTGNVKSPLQNKQKKQQKGINKKDNRTKN